MPDVYVSTYGFRLSLFTLTLPEPGPSVTFLTPCSCSTRVFTFFESPAFFSHWTFFQELEQEWLMGCRKRGGRTKKRGNVPHPCPLQQAACLRPWVGQWGGRPKLQSHALASHCHRGHLSAGGSLGTNEFKINISQFHENGILGRRPLYKTDTHGGAPSKEVVAWGLPIGDPLISPHLTTSLWGSIGVAKAQSKCAEVGSWSDGFRGDVQNI